MDDADHENHDDSCDCTNSGLGRRAFVGGCGATLAFAFAGGTVGTAAAQEAGDVAALLENLPTNWGRWGDDDELGALNFLGSEQAFDGMRAATKRGRKGIERFTLQLSVTGEVINPDPDQPETIFPPTDGSEPTFPSTDIGDPAFPPRTPGRRDNTTPSGGSESAGGVTFVDDKFVSDFFLQGTTHLDALGHAWYGDEIYNGFDASTTESTKEFDTPLLGTAGADAVPDNDDRESLEPVSETKGLDKASVSEPASAGLAGRGILLDVGREFGDSDGRLPLEACITYDDLLATAEAQDVEIRERDLLLIRTGAIARARDPDAEWGPLIEPGLCFSEELVEWVHEMEFPYIGADNLAVEKVTQEIDGETYVIPLHGAFLRNLGVNLNEILWLEGLATQCATDGIYDFLFTGAPLKVERASGAPINPVVLKATKER